MKKLLTLLGSITIASTSATMVVACGINYDKKDNDGNSILVHFLKKLDGKAEISTMDALYEMLNQTGRESFAIDILNMISLSILANAKDNWGPDSSKENKADPLNANHNYYNYNLPDTLAKRWTNLENQVDAQIDNEKKKYKKDHGKKWEKKWKEMLFDKYSVYQDDVKNIDQQFLEDKYKADILLTDSKNSASKALMDVLLNTNQAGVTWVTTTDLKKSYISLLKIQNNDQLLTTLKSDPLIISQLENSMKTDISEWKAPKKYENNDSDLLKDFKAIKDKLGNNDSKIISDVPKTIAEFNAFNANETRGFLSNSQRFFLDKWYNTQAPLAISELVIPYAEGKTFDNGIDLSSFEGTDANKEHGHQTAKLLNEISKDTDLKTWNKSLSTGKNEYIYKGTVGYDWAINKHDSLLTLNSSSFSQDLKTVVYDYVLDNSFETGNQSNGFPTDESLATLAKFLEKIDRNQEEDSHGRDPKNKTYTILKEGMLAYVDEEGMHIVNIDGFDYFKASTKNDPKNNGGQKGIIEGKIEKNNLEELNNFKKYSRHKDKEKIEIITNPTKAPGSNQEKPNGYDVTYEELNTQISNEYLRYLANNSLISGLTNSPVSYDILTEVKNWAQISASTAASEESAGASYWITCILEYFYTISETEKDLNKFIDQFVVFVTNSENNNQEQVEKLSTSFKNSIKTAKSFSESSGQASLNSSAKKRREELKKSAATSATFPKQYIDSENINEANTIEKVNGKWKIEKNDKVFNYKDTLKNSSNYLLTKTINNHLKNTVAGVNGGVK